MPTEIWHPRLSWRSQLRSGGTRRRGEEEKRRGEEEKRRRGEEEKRRRGEEEKRERTRRKQL